MNEYLTGVFFGKKKNIKSRFTWIMDPGHGGVIDGKYQTSTKKWKRSYYKNGELLDPNRGVIWLEENCDFKYYEGEGTRDIVRRVKNKLDNLSINYIDAVDSETDVPLGERVGTANNFYKKDKKCIYLSVHSDAFTDQRGKGFTVYTSKGKTNSDLVANIFFKELSIALPDYKPRTDPSDGDPDKEENFYVLKNTAMPAVLLELLFYTNYEEAKYLSSEEGRENIANAIVKAIVHIEENGY